MRSALTSAGLALLTIALLAAGVCWYTNTAANSPASACTGLLPTSDGLRFRGVAIQVASGYQPLETYGPMLREIADLGADAVLLSVAGFMEHARSQSIFIEARKVPAPGEFVELIRQAHQLDLSVIVMPIILLENPRGSEWRGVIDPPDWNKWWDDYYEFVLYFADIARKGHADALIVGSELVSAEKYTDRWVHLIGQVRQRFHGGLLGYSANWDHYRPVQFWDRLDFVGMTSYFTLAKEQNPSVASIVERWQPIKADILNWQKDIGKPILFTEVGWCSQEGAATAPWNYYQNQHATPAGLEEQRRLYEAFIRVWSDVPGLLGVIWWEWSAGGGGPSDFGYTPRKKPAEGVLREWFRATSQPATQPS